MREMGNPRPVVAVIPHYNMPQTLQVLLKQAIGQGYDAIYVLDDHSTKCSIRDVVAPFGQAVHLVAGERNLGAGGNRNRILGVGGHGLKGAILHFIDADCELLSHGIPDKLRKLMAQPELGVVVGLVLDYDGTQYLFNYSPRLSWLFGVSVRAQHLLSMLVRRNIRLARRLRPLFSWLLQGYSDPTKPPVATDVFGFSEANFAVSYDVFARVGGFDNDLRYQQAQDLAYKLVALGLRRRFDPSFVVKHHAVQVRRWRSLGYIRSTLQIIRNHGLPGR